MLQLNKQLSAEAILMIRALGQGFASVMVSKQGRNLYSSVCVCLWHCESCGDDYIDKHAYSQPSPRFCNKVAEGEVLVQHLQGCSLVICNWLPAGI